MQADVSRTGRLSFAEVGSLLVKSDGTHFAFPVLWVRIQTHNESINDQIRSIYAACLIGPKARI